MLQDFFCALDFRHCERSEGIFLNNQIASFLAMTN